MFDQSNLPSDSALWLTSFWGFEPESWGCLGFSADTTRDYFIKRTKPGVIVAIYVTKGRGPDEERGRLVGFLEVSHQSGNLREFISGDQRAAIESDPTSRGKWLYALKVTRAWRVIPEEQQLIDYLLPETYQSSSKEFIGSHGIPVVHDEVKKLLALAVLEVPVYGQVGRIETGMQPFQNVLKPSRAILPAQEPYWVGETDGPKHLYILRLHGDIATYLGRSSVELEDKMVVKVGFSRSPLSRRDQIQAAYPAGNYKWEVLYPQDVVGEPPYPSAEIAIAGEDAMKARLQDDGAESLGREFFLADHGLVIRTWAAGTYAADSRTKRFHGNANAN